MRRLPLLTLPFMAAVPLHAQLHAGEVPQGSIAIGIGATIALPDPFTEDSVLLETDCDDSFDLVITLLHGMPAIDAPNTVVLRTLDDDLELCRDAERPYYYGAGELLTCTGAFSWQSNNINILGDYGGFGMIGPSTVDSLYLGIRQGALSGWVLLSFDLTDTVPILHVHQALSFCMATTTGEPATAGPVVIAPTVTHGEPVRIGIDASRSLEVLDATGRTMARYGPNVREIAAPREAGLYFLRVERTDGTWSCGRFVRR